MTADFGDLSGLDDEPLTGCAAQTFGSCVETPHHSHGSHLCARFEHDDGPHECGCSHQWGDDDA